VKALLRSLMGAACIVVVFGVDLVLGVVEGPIRWVASHAENWSRSFEGRARESFLAEKRGSCVFWASLFIVVGSTTVGLTILGWATAQLKKGTTSVSNSLTKAIKEVRM